MRLIASSTASTLILSLALAACGDDEADAPPEPAEAPAAPAEAPRTVTIVSPSEGAEVEGPSVTVELDVEGMEIRPAGDMMEGTGHHHIFLDADLSPAGAPVPTVRNEVVHLGDGSASYTFEDVEPGEHRLIAVVADGAHVPLEPWVVDTVTFTVR